MKKYVDWDKVEDGTEKETCECTRSKFQSFIDLIWPKRIKSLTAEESMKCVREEYERRNRTCHESWMTRHDREYLNWQKGE
jgi:hypothetical protein